MKPIEESLRELSAKWRATENDPNARHFTDENGYDVSILDGVTCADELDALLAQPTADAVDTAEGLARIDEPPAPAPPTPTQEDAEKLAFRIVSAHWFEHECGTQVEFDRLKSVIADALKGKP